MEKEKRLKTGNSHVGRFGYVVEVELLYVSRRDMHTRTHWLLIIFNSFFSLFFHVFVSRYVSNS